MVKPFLEMTDEDWHGLLAANLHGYFYGCRAAARQMVAQGTGGRIINVTSVVDIQPIAELSAYVTAKGGILGLTKTLAVELGPHGITVNALSPGRDRHAAQPGRVHARRCARTTTSASRSGGSPRPRRSPTPFALPRLGRVALRHGLELLVDGGHRPERQRRARADARRADSRSRERSRTSSAGAGSTRRRPTRSTTSTRPPVRRARPGAALDRGRRGAAIAAAADAFPAWRATSPIRRGQTLHPGLADPRGRARRRSPGSSPASRARRWPSRAASFRA